MLILNKTAEQVLAGELVYKFVSIFKAVHNKNTKTNEMWYNREHSKNK